MSEINSMKSKLYAIVDKATCDEHKISLTDFCKGFFEAGGRLLQYRDKRSSRRKIQKNLERILKISESYQAFCILNDYLDIALEMKTPFHLGQEDITQLGISSEKLDIQGMLKDIHKDIFWGLSIHDKKEIQTAKTFNTDYIGFGSVFRSQTKITRSRQMPISEVLRQWEKPIVFIGGITLNNVKILPKGEHIFYAVIRDFFSYGCSAKSIEKYTRDFL